MDPIKIVILAVTGFTGLLVATQGGIIGVALLLLAVLVILFGVD